MTLADLERDAALRLPGADERLERFHETRLMRGKAAVVGRRFFDGPAEIRAKITTRGGKQGEAKALADAAVQAWLGATGSEWRLASEEVLERGAELVFVSRWRRA